MKHSYIFFAALFLVFGQARANFPQNNLGVYDNVNGPTNVTEETFNSISDKIVAIWQPIAKMHGATLTVEKRWMDSTVNAYATQSGNNWQVHMFGGLARRPEITPDGFALVVCHELGHHFGGYAFVDDSQWAANEGQADYFASDVCAKHIFAQFFDRRFMGMNDVPPFVKLHCDAAWNNAPAQSLCYRTAAAGLSLATLLSKLGGPSTLPQFTTPDPNVVSKTDPNHPEAQCRLDTYFAGAVCNAPFDPKVIPGRGASQMSPQAETMAAQYSCMDHSKYQQGFRPLCWFKPLTSGAGS